jgi:hypothetical protein
VAVRGPQHGDVLPDVVDPDDPLHPTPLDWPLALQLHAEFDEERDHRVEVVDNDEDVVHPLDRHVRFSLMLRGHDDHTCPWDEAAGPFSTSV